MDFNVLDASNQNQRAKQFGQFYLQELINSGGAADIWVATDAQGKTFALRHLQSRHKFNLVARKRFMRGSEILAHIHHNEYVIGYVKHGKIDNLPYLLMEYVESSNLKQLMLRSDDVLVENVANILIDMALAIEHVHDSGFMHLDFKPENIPSRAMATFVSWISISHRTNRKSQRNFRGIPARPPTCRRNNYSIKRSIIAPTFLPMVSLLTNCSPRASRLLAIRLK